MTTLGKKFSTESRRKMSISASLRKRSQLSEETKRKISESNKGKVRSEETRAKISLAKKGKRAKWMIGNNFQKGYKNVHFGKFGKNHPCWKEKKKHPFHRQIRQLFKYRQWRSDVFTRDDFTCVLCGINGCYIEADHYPKRFIEIINEYNIQTLDEALNCEELWNINNGRTLCQKCHNPTKGRYKIIRT